MSGELRPVSSVRQRIEDAAKVGISTVVLPSSSRSGLEKDKDKISKIELIFVDNIQEAADVLFS